MRALFEGFDFNENNAGDLRVNMQLVEASRNGEEGIDYEEDDDDALAGSGGNLVTVMNGVVTVGNGVFAEDNNDTGSVTLSNVSFPGPNGLGDTGGNLLAP